MSLRTPEEMRDFLATLQALSDVTVGLEGSLLPDVLALCSDAMLLLSKAFLRPLRVKPNPSLAFLEDLPAYAGLINPLAAGAVYDPVEDKYVFPQYDPLGNPLQVEVDLGSNLEFSYADALIISDFFEKLSEVMIFLSSGRIDFKFIKTLKSTFSTSFHDSKKGIRENKRKSKNHFYRKRKKARSKRKPVNKNSKKMKT